MTTAATYPPVKTQILEQIEEAQAELVLDDDAILQLPHIVFGVMPTGEALLIDRLASLVEASHRASEIAVAAGGQYDEVAVMTLRDLGFPAASSSTVVDEPETVDADDVVELDDDSAADEPLAEADGQTMLVDRSQYEREDLAIPKIDGNQVDRIALSFAGTVFLDRSDPDHVRIYNALTMGRSGLTLKVTGRCSGTAGKLATDKGGSLDVVVGTKTLKVESVDVPAGGLL